MLSTGDITKETVNTNNDSTYKSYLTTMDCGVYMFDGSASSYNIYPIFFSITNTNNFFNAVNASGNSFPSGYYNTINGAAVGTFYTMDLSDIDDYYLVMPSYGITAWNLLNYGAPVLLNFYNNSTIPITVKPSSPNSVTSCKIYYKGVEITA
jgi:hypothetical protein